MSIRSLGVLLLLCQVFCACSVKFNNVRDLPSDGVLSPPTISSHSDGFSLDRSFVRFRGTCQAGAQVQATLSQGQGRILRSDCSSSGVLSVNVKFLGGTGRKAVQITQSLNGLTSSAIEIGGTLASGHILDVGAGRDYTTIHAGVAAASSGDIVAIDSGEYVESGQLLLDKNIVVEGYQAEGSVLKLGGNLPNVSDDASCWVLVPFANTVTLRGLTFHGNGKVVRLSLYLHGPTTLENNIFYDLSNRQTYPNDRGIAVLIEHQGLVRNNWFREIQRAGVYVEDEDGAGPENGQATVEYNTFTGRTTGSGDESYAAVVQTGGALSFYHNRVEGYTLPYTTYSPMAINTWQGSTIVKWNDFGPVSAGAVGIWVDAVGPSDTTLVQYNRFSGSWPQGQMYQFVLNPSANGAGASADLRYNWWGDALGPSDGVSPGAGALYVEPGNTMDFSSWLTSSDQAGWTEAGYVALD